MATPKYPRKVEDVKKLALAAGFTEAELEGLNRTQLIELLEESAENNGTGADSVKEGAGEVVESVDDFDGDTLHVHQKSPDGASSEFVRTYSEEQHGENFKELAKSFIGKDSKRFATK